jgi:hypothetical protein
MNQEPKWFWLVEKAEDKNLVLLSLQVQVNKSK